MSICEVCCCLAVVVLLTLLDFVELVVDLACWDFGIVTYLSWQRLLLKSLWHKFGSDTRTPRKCRLLLL